MKIVALVDDAFIAEAEVRNRSKLFVRQYGTTAALRKLAAFLLVVAWLSFGPYLPVECRIMREVTGCALIEVG